VDVRGGAPATRETDLLRPGNLVERVHAALLSGGSASGLDAASGVMRWLEERSIGYPVTGGVVPIVPAACLYDYSLTGGKVRPGPAEGYAACGDASAKPVVPGCTGAGAGASVGKGLGIERAMKGALGSAAEYTAAGVAVGALVAVNAWGEVIDPETAQIKAGARAEAPGTFVPALEIVRESPPLSPFSPRENSTIAVVATDAALTKEQAYRVAVIAQTGLARTIRPVHTPVDGDVVFALATGKSTEATDALQVGALAAYALERAVLKAVRSATSFGEVVAAADWR
jgi:L-aminopeptidase/D-esterase-like protein